MHSKILQRLGSRLYTIYIEKYQVSFSRIICYSLFLKNYKVFDNVYFYDHECYLKNSIHEKHGLDTEWNRQNSKRCIFTVSCVNCQVIRPSFHAETWTVVSGRDRIRGGRLSILLFREYLRLLTFTESRDKTVVGREKGCWHRGNDLN